MKVINKCETCYKSDYCRILNHEKCNGQYAPAPSSPFNMEALCIKDCIEQEENISAFII